MRNERYASIKAYQSKAHRQKETMTWKDIPLLLLIVAIFTVSF